MGAQFGSMVGFRFVKCVGLFVAEFRAASYVVVFSASMAFGEMCNDAVPGMKIFEARGTCNVGNKGADACLDAVLAISVCGQGCVRGEPCSA